MKLLLLALITACLLMSNCSLATDHENLIQDDLLVLKEIEAKLEESEGYSFSQRVRDLALQEWSFFGKQVIKNRSILREGRKESEEGYWQRVSVYWNEGTNQDLTGKDTDWPWSAAFMSWIMFKAGAGENFTYSIRHSDYITDAISNRKNNLTNSHFLGFRINEYSPLIGDLVCYGRKDYINYDTPGPYPSHCDIVIDKHDQYISVIGGNVGDSVTLKILDVDNNGILIDDSERWFVVIKNNLSLEE